MKKMKMAGFLFVYFGIFALILFGKCFLNSNATKNWPSVKGKILESEVKETRDRKSTSAKILYEYDVDDTTYTSNRIRAFGVLIFHPAESASAVDEFPAGKEVPVFYDPDEPSNSVLLHGPPNKLYIFVLVPIVLLFLGSFLILKEYVDKQDREKEAAQAQENKEE